MKISEFRPIYKGLYRKKGKRGVVTENLKEKFVSKTWAESYIFTNRLIEDICKKLSQTLKMER